MKHRRNLPAYVHQYREAFHKHYPMHTCDVRPRRQIDGSIGWIVSINGSTDGSRALSERDMQEAILSFNA